MRYWRLMWGKEPEQLEKDTRKHSPRSPLEYLQHLQGHNYNCSYEEAKYNLLDDV